MDFPSHYQTYNYRQASICQSLNSIHPTDPYRVLLLRLILSLIFILHISSNFQYLNKRPSLISHPFLQLLPPAPPPPPPLPHLTTPLSPPPPPASHLQDPSSQPCLTILHITSLRTPPPTYFRDGLLAPPTSTHLQDPSCKAPYHIPQRPPFSP